MAAAACAADWRAAVFTFWEARGGARDARALVSLAEQSPSLRDTAALSRSVATLQALLPGASVAAMVVRASAVRARAACCVLWAGRRARKKAGALWAVFAQSGARCCLAASCGALPPLRALRAGACVALCSRRRTRARTRAPAPPHRRATTQQAVSTRKKTATTTVVALLHRPALLLFTRAARRC
jgi:hypothetical protein